MCVWILIDFCLVNQEYVGLWLGCAKIGVVPALINSNLKGQPLVHSLTTASAMACIYGTEHSEGE